MTDAAPNPIASPVPGWYLDPSDPGAKRFWDGTAWTERKMANPPSPSERIGPTNAEPVARHATSLADQVVLGVVRDSDIRADEPVLRASHNERFAEDDGAADHACLPCEPTTGQNPSTLGNPETIQAPGDALAREVSNWAEQAQDAISRALTVGSVAAWRDVVQCAAMVAHVVTAADALRDVTSAVEEANRALLQSTSTAEEATKAAQAAALAAETAGQVAQAAIQAAQAAAESALAATQRAEQVETAVTKARAANTQEAWREAAQVADAVLPTGETDDTSTSDS
ncbi:MAG TPA: DUF2510 domain-containing protein [Acidimicrobiales bacterium]|nr:DUF2510 domain-containing protein [Acidimicrobiales bacterium]